MANDGMPLIKAYGQPDLAILNEADKFIEPQYRYRRVEELKFNVPINEH
jgi:hypothetical protein